MYELWRKPMWMNCPMETFVLINNLQLHCPIGVMEQEQVIGNDFCINLRIGYDFTRAMTSDDVGDTLNYAAVYQRPLVAGLPRVPSSIAHFAGAPLMKARSVLPEANR